MELECEHGRVEEWGDMDHVVAAFPMDDFGYAEAILHWEATGRSPDSIFSCQDPWLILYRRELSARFGLRLLTQEEAEAHKKHSPNVEFDPTIATGDPMYTPEYNQPPKKAEAIADINRLEREMRRAYPHLWFARGGES